MTPPPNYFRFVKHASSGGGTGAWVYYDTILEHQNPPGTDGSRAFLSATALEENNVMTINFVRNGFATVDAWSRDDSGTLQKNYSITSSATVKHLVNDGLSPSSPGLPARNMEARYNPSQDSIWYLAVSHSTSATRGDFEDSSKNLSMYRAYKTDGVYAAHEKLYDDSNVGYSERGRDRQFYFLKSDCSEILARKNGEYDSFYILKSSTGEILQTIDLPNYDAGNLNVAWTDERHSGIDVSTSRDRFVIRGNLASTTNEYGDSSNCIGLQVFKSASAGWELEHEKAIATVDTNNVSWTRWTNSAHRDNGLSHFNTNITDDYIAISTPDYWDESNPTGTTRALNGAIWILKKTNGTDWSGGSEKVFFLQSTGAWSDLNDGDMSAYPFAYGVYGEMGQTLSMAPNGDFAFSDPSNAGGQRLWIYTKDSGAETWSFSTASAGNTTTYHTEGEYISGTPLVCGNNYVISSEGTKPAGSFTNTIAQTYAEYKKE